MDKSLAPWHLDELIEAWNSGWAEPMRFRSFQHKSDGPKGSLRRYRRILDANRRWLLSGRSVPLEALHQECIGQLRVVSAWLQQQPDLELVSEGLDIPLQTTMGWWHFSRPDLSNLAALFGLATGQGLHVDQAHLDARQEKARAIAELDGLWDEVKRRAVMKLEKDQIKALRPVVLKAMSEIEDQIDQAA